MLQFWVTVRNTYIMAKRLFTPRHREIVKAQQELLRWCPNVEGVSHKDLECACWACGARCDEGLTRCHIDRYRPNEQDRPDNFVILCDVCHRGQPDALPKGAIKYWLFTRESQSRRAERLAAPILTAFRLLTDEFGESAVTIALGEVKKDEGTDAAISIARRYAEKSAGQGSRNLEANWQWGLLAEIHAWCVAKDGKVDSDMQEIERRVAEQVAALRKQQFLFDKRDGE
jgi:5-methylcytosine-specific restriction endonuclease McrA